MQLAVMSKDQCKNYSLYKLKNPANYFDFAGFLFWH
mgnify:CR=1 FL=1